MGQCRTLVLLSVSALFGLFSVEAGAATQVPSGTYNSDVTWTVTGSPYVINGDLTIASGATLTIDPGVIVKMNGQLRTIRVDGAIEAIGTSGSRITFTSYDDDLGGDTNGDGASVGSPGDWYTIHFRNGSTGSEFTYVDVRFGGWGSQDWAYGAVTLTDGSTIALDHTRMQQNDRSGLLVGVSATAPYAGATVTHSEFSSNGNGISVNNGWLSMSANSLAAENDKDGIWFNLSGSYAGPTTYITQSEVTENGRYGIYYNQISLALLPSQKPYGDENNIWANGNGRQLYTLYSHFFVDWSNNYWGENKIDLFCPLAPFPEHPWHVADSPLGFASEGPISSQLWVQDEAQCRADRIATFPSEPSYIDNSGY